MKVACFSPRGFFRIAQVAVFVACGSNEPIRIGLAGPVSQLRGRSMQQAADLAINQINEAGGISGRPVELVIADDSASTEAAVTVATRFVQDPTIVGVVGHLTSATTLAAAPVYNGGTAPLVAISPSASSPAITSAGAYTFRVCPSDFVHASKLAEWAQSQLGAQRAAILYQNDDYGRGVRSTFATSFGDLGGAVVYEAPYVIELPSFEPFLRVVQQLGGADVLLIAGERVAADRILVDVRATNSRLHVMGGDGLTGLQDSDAAEGVLISNAYLPEGPSAQNAEFVASYRRAFNGELPDHRAAGTYDIIHLFARAIDTVGSDRNAIRDYLAAVGRGSPVFQGVTGAIAFDDNGDVRDRDVVIGVVSNGRLIAAPGS